MNKKSNHSAELLAAEIEIMPLHVFKKNLHRPSHATLRQSSYMMFVIVRGELTHFVDCTERHCVAHDYLLIKPNQIHRFTETFDCEGWVLIFSPELLLTEHREEEILYQMPTAFSMSPSLFAACVNHLKTMRQDTLLNAPKSEITALLRHQLSSLILRLRLESALFDFNLETDHAKNARFNRFRLLLEAHYHQAHHVGFYADKLGLSHKTLNRLCLHITGAPAKTVITQRIVLEAKRLLVHTADSIQKISDALSFDEASNFSKVFKKTTQLTPRQFRNAHQ